MSESAEYDNLLRSVFNSCDRTGNGYLSLYEFGDLCSQLCLEDNQLLLQKVLFKKRTKLGYEQFKEVLLLLLAGSLTDSTSECAEISGHEGQDLIDFDQEPLLKSEILEVDSSNILNEKDFKHSHQPTPMVTSQPLSPFCENKSNVFVIEFEDENERKKDDSFSDSFEAWSPPSLSPIKKYGRRSIPDEDLLRNNETYNRRIGKKLPTSEQLVPATPPAEEVERKKRSIFENVVEEYVGEGDGGDWVNPDHDIAMDAVKEINGNSSFNESDSAEDAQKALASVWLQTVGNFDQKINLSNFQYLFHVQAPETSSDDIAQLFEVLDDDKDGLITYVDFSKQMSAFMTTSAEDQNLSCDSQKQKSKMLENGDNVAPKTWPLTNKNAEENGLSSYSNIAATSDRIHIKSSSQVSLKHEDDVTMTSSAMVANDSKPNATEHPPEKSAIDSIINEAEEPMQRYHGVPPYRRRRRSAQRSLRHQCRQTSRMQSLPYYHPMSKKKVEECPLFFLTEDDENFVLSEKIRNILNDEGIDDADDVFQELGLGLNNSFNVESLVDAFEAELKRNPVHYALCALYKNGISFYKSQNEQQVSDKKKIESMLKLMDTQMEEQEERIEKLEVEYREKVEATESRYKSKLARLRIKLETEQDRQEQQKMEETREMKLQIEKLKASQTQLQTKLSAKEAENIELSQTCTDLQGQLKESNSDLISLRTKFVHVYDQTLLQEQGQAKQQRRLDKMLEESQKLRDRNKELLEEMKCISKHWNIDYQTEGAPSKENTALHLAQNSNEDVIGSAASIQSTASASQFSFLPATKSVSSPNSSRYVNKILFTPLAQRASLIGPTTEQSTESVLSKTHHVSTFFMKSTSLSGTKQNLEVQATKYSTT